MWQKLFTGFSAALVAEAKNLAEQLTALSRERSEAETLKKHLPICQEHGKSCCLFYAGRGPKAQHHSIWLTNHWNFKTQRSDSTVFLQEHRAQSRRAGPQGSRKNKKLLGFGDCLCTTDSYHMDLN